MCILPSLMARPQDRVCSAGTGGTRPELRGRRRTSRLFRPMYKGVFLAWIQLQPYSDLHEVLLEAKSPTFLGTDREVKQILHLNATWAFPKQ